MRQVIYGGAVSADGFLAGAGEALDWLRWSDDAAKISAKNFAGADTMLIGRKTFEIGQKMGGGPPMKGVTTYVFSRTLERLPEGIAGKLVNVDAAEFVRALKRQDGGKIIVMGGGEIGTALLNAGLVDEIGLSVHPVLLGAGIPAFGVLDRRVELELLETRPIARECVYLRYRVTG